jgi:hypothetical protein
VDGPAHADRAAPIAVLPYFAVAEASYRLAGCFPGRDAGADCPSELCVRGERRIYGASLVTLPAVREREPAVYVWIRAGAAPELPRCGPILREAGTVLLRCGAPP